MVKKGFINKRGKEIIPLVYDNISGNFLGGIAKVGINGKQGYINTKGEEIIPIQYDWVDDYFNDKTGTLTVERDGKRFEVNMRNECEVNCP
ncbi:WG repeat-containing protein [Capnocytophaga canimorsus]|nr:WG repeat-containing protein [Capnocytophaga canimorsus]WGU68021.1 WG repeat-containing protein [Capnocytophaga canimorsus]WGU70879.1 WG repeat-containing protein [Capnocytophaga canimorsus]